MAWARRLGREVLRLKGELLLSELPEGPVRFDRAGNQQELAEAPSDAEPSPEPTTPREAASAALTATSAA